MSSDDGLEPYLRALEADLQAAALPFPAADYPQLHEMIAYHHGWQGQVPSRGKRVRPLLTLLACHACGGAWERALPAASAVELIHNFSLVHDDIEDHSATRRGRATIWSRWGVAQALNTGDALFALAQLSLHRLMDHGVDPAIALAIQFDLASACLMLTQGQHLDLAFETMDAVPEAAYLRMVEGKTAALLAAAPAIGSRLAGVSPPAIDHYREFGLHVGLAFQMQDDILGIWGQPEVTGKPAGDDLRSRKTTLPILIGLDASPEFRGLWGAHLADDATVARLTALLEGCGALAATRARAQEHTDRALTALTAAGPRGPAAGLLREVAQRMMGRQS